MTVEIPEIEGLTRDQILTLSRARKLEQFEDMIRAYRDGKCLFCDPLGEKNIVVHEAHGWRIWVNPIPEKRTRVHLVMASVRHIGPDDEILPEDFVGIGEMFRYARAEFKIPGGGLLMRFGSTEFNAGTMLHLHANIMEPDLSGEVRVPLAKTPEKVQMGFDRLWAFKKLLDGASPDDLTDHERAAAGL